MAIPLINNSFSLTALRTDEVCAQSSSASCKPIPFDLDTLTLIEASQSSSLSWAGLGIGIGLIWLSATNLDDPPPPIEPSVRQKM